MKKKQTAFNTHLLICFILFPLFLYLSIACFMEKTIVMGVIFALITLITAAVFLTSPLYFVFSEESVEIVYNFGQREKIIWDDVISIKKGGGWIKGNGYPHYAVDYPKPEKQKFFMIGEIAKTIRTRKLLALYYGTKI